MLQWYFKVILTKLFLFQDIFYSRKNFERPDLQMKPHCSFEQEVALLDKIFADGAAYCMGTINRWDFFVWASFFPNFCNFLF